MTEALLLEDAATPAGATGPGLAMRLSAWSVARRALLWQRPLLAFSRHSYEFGLPEAEWPIAEDLDGDGRAEVIVPNDSAAAQPRTSHLAHGSLEVLDGATGKPRWTRRVQTADQQVDAISVAPDINGDGCRDLCVAAFWGDPCELYVEALSGADGERLWLSHRGRLFQNQQMPRRSSSGRPSAGGEAVAGTNCWSHSRKTALTWEESR